MRKLALRLVRKALRRLDVALQGPGDAVAVACRPPDRRQFERFRSRLLALRLHPESRPYLQMHLERLARTLTLVPPPGSTGRILELGCYMQMTPLLAEELGYAEVCGAYLGPTGESHEKSVETGDGVFRCTIDLFDAEQDRFPYPDGHFDTALACEILEHLARDPMHMLVECRRVLADGGALLLTTPNSVSLTSVARALTGETCPQVFSRYPDPRKNESCGPHVREYSPGDLVAAVEAAGFHVETLLAERADGFTADTWVLDVLRDGGFDAALRGEQLFCVARKVAGARIDRYPAVLYEALGD